MSEQEFEQRLRSSLATHAHDAPRSDAVERRILDAAVVQPVSHRRNPWRAYVAPLVAAGAVAAVVIGIVAIGNDHPTASNHRIGPATQGNSETAPSPTHTTSPPPTATRTPERIVTVGTAITVPGRRDIQLQDLSFVGSDIWATAWAECTDQVGVTCTAMLHSTDGGATWRDLTPPTLHVVKDDCGFACSMHVRFATDQIGYVFDTSELYLTTNGGRSWQQQPGGADALETLDGNVIRIVPTLEGCSPPGCTYTAQTASIGATTWHDTGLRATAQGTTAGVALVRSGSLAVLAAYGHTAGGAGSARTILYVSHDDGATWSTRDEPCVTTDVEVDTTAIALATDGSLFVLCDRRDSGTPETVRVSTDGGQTFTAAGSLGGLHRILAAPSRQVLFVGDPGLVRSADGGSSWRSILHNDPLSWLGFQSASEGAAVSGDGRTIYRTTNGGRNWTSRRFS
ncbi:MAG TPA: hypothetical protein VJ831_13280 [Jatrophihabitantaceae bacterium]|nr:hypothetical protein [Jatrophihabitantaceae bacterium]